MRLFDLVLFSALGALAMMPAVAQPAAASTPDLPPRVVASTDQAQFRRLVLDNGLRVMLLSDPRLNRSSGSMSARVGQIDDPRETPGMAHFLEHVVSRGNAKYPGENEFIEYIGRNGGSRNAYTSSDHTNYQFEVRHDALEGALDRLAHCFISPAFKPELLAREINAVHNESMRYIQTDSWRIFAAMREVYDPASGESKFSTGNKDTLVTATQPAVRAFFDLHYSPERMALAVTGRASLDELEKLVREKFSAIPKRGPGAAEHTARFLPRKEALRLVRVEPLRELRQLQMEFVLPATRTMFASRADRLLISLIEHAGPGGLVDKLKREGLANRLETLKYDRTAQYGSLILTLDLTPEGEREVGKVMEAVLGFATFLRRAPFPRAYFDELARIGLLEETYGNRGEGSALAVRLANQTLFYPLAVAERANTAWGAPNEADYRRLLDALVPENLIALLAAKGVKTDRKEAIYGVAYSVEESGGPLYAALKSPAIDRAFALPGANRFMPASTALLPERAQPLIDEPGLALHYAPDSEFQRPQTAIVVRFVPVRAVGGVEQTALLNLWGRALMDAIDNDLADAVAAGGRLTTDFQLDGLRFSASGYGDSPARVVRRIAERLRTFNVAPARYADLQEQAVRALASYQQTEAFTVAADRRQAMQREFRYQPDQLLPRTRSASWADVQRFGLQLLARGRLEVLVHGHIKPEDAIAATRAMAASIAAQPAPTAELLKRRHLVMAPGETLVDTGLVAGANAAWNSEHVLVDDSPRIRAAGVLLTSFVAGPFFGEMRTRQQLGYIAGAGGAVSVRERSLSFVIQSSTHPSAELRQRAETFIASLPAALAALSPAEWAGLKAGTRSRLEEKPTSIGERAERLFAEAYVYDGDWGRAQSSLAALEALTQAEAVALLTELLDPAKARRRVVMLDPVSKPPAVAQAPSFTDREGWKRDRQYR